MGVLEDYENDLQTAFFEARNSENVDKNAEYKTQQGLYRKFAQDMDQVVADGEYNYSSHLAGAISGVFPEKSPTILDYGCGTGYLAELLVQKYGFDKTLDGMDPCKEILEVAKGHNRMRNYFNLGSADDHSVMGFKNYDMVCSSGVFFCTPSHPNLDCIPQLCNLVKKGGYIYICTGQSYMKLAQMEHAERFEIEEKIKILPTEVFDGYRKATALEEGQTVKGVILKFQVIA